MALAALHPEERSALLLAVVLHVALVALLLFQPRSQHSFPMPKRIAVSLVDEVALESAGPVLSREARLAEAPALADEPAPTPVQAERVTPVPASQQQSQSRPISPPSPPKPATKAGGASRIGSDFLEGAESGSRDADAPMPASQIGSAAKASLAQALARQLKPYWSSPQGVDVELLVTVLSFDLNEDGSLDGRPRVVSQSGITDANRPQAGRHAEMAIRAVQLAAPFDLPVRYYNAWKHVSAFRFDRKLSQ